MGVDAGLDTMTGRVEGNVARSTSATPYCSSPLMNLVTSQAFRFPSTRAAYANDQQSSREKN
jgi:hypothetical protein